MDTFNNPQRYAVSKDIRCKVVLECLEKHGGRLKCRGGERVLDIGCGIGDVTHRCIFPLLPRDFKQLVCADASTDMLNVAKSEFLGIEHVYFRQMDIGATLEESLMGTFDKIFSTFCLMYVPDQKKAFENIFRLLAPGGECFIMLVITGAIFETGFQVLELPKWKDRLKRYREVFVFPYREDPDPVKTLEDLLKSVGFKNVFVKRENFNHIYPTLEDFKETLKCIPDYPKDLTEEEKLDFLNDRINVGSLYNIIKEFRDESIPPKHIAFKNLIIHAEKA